jgi:hypothetical protein
MTAFNSSKPVEIILNVYDLGQ